MQLLTILTLIYAAVLVLALAASLIAILVYLRRIASALADVHRVLEVVERETDPLAEHLQQVEATADTAAKSFADAGQRLEQTNERLTALAQGTDVTERVRS